MYFKNIMSIHGIISLFKVYIFTHKCCYIILWFFILILAIKVHVYHNFYFNLHFKMKMLMLKMMRKFYVIILILCILIVKYLSKSFVHLLIRLLLLLLLIFGRFCIIYIHFTFLNMWFTNTSTSVLH